MDILIFIFTFLIVCLLLAVAYAYFEYKKLTAFILKVIILTTVLCAHVNAEDPPECAAACQQPMVFPNQLPQASHSVSHMISDAFGLSDHGLFLSDDYWPRIFAGNNTTFMTA